MKTIAILLFLSFSFTSFAQTNKTTTKKVESYSADSIANKYFRNTKKMTELFFKAKKSSNQTETSSLKNEREKIRGKQSGLLNQIKTGKEMMKIYKNFYLNCIDIANNIVLSDSDTKIDSLKIIAVAYQTSIFDINMALSFFNEITNEKLKETSSYNKLLVSVFGVERIIFLPSNEFKQQVKNILPQLNKQIDSIKKL